MIVTVDTGGTKTLIAQFERDGKIGKTLKFPTPPKEKDYVELLRKTLEENFNTGSVEAISIAMPGIVKEGVATWCNNLKWKNFNVHKALEGVLNNAPILVENDANLAGLAETRAIDPMPRSSIYVTVSTGIGTGMITNGRIDPGLRYSEGGRMFIEYKGEVKEWELFSSGKTIVKEYGKYASEIKSKKIWDEIADRISRGLLVMIPIIQPDVIVIGGSVGTYFDNYKDSLRDIVKAKLPTHITFPKIKQAKHPEEAVIYGCYYYAIDHLADIQDKI